MTMRSKSDPVRSLLGSLNEEITGLANHVVQSTAIVTGQTRDFDQGSGSPWLIDPLHLATNHHVVQHLVEPIWVRLPGRTELQVAVVGRDELTDLAVLRVCVAWNPEFDSARSATAAG